MMDVSKLVGLLPTGFNLLGLTTEEGKPVVSDLPDKDAREQALAQLRRYIAALTFTRTTDQLPQPFRIPRASIHLYQPDAVKGLNYPSIAFLPGEGTSDDGALGGPSICEDKIGAYGENTAVARIGEWTETIKIEVTATRHASRRAVVAGLEVALRPFQETSALALRLPDYFDTTAAFEYLGRAPQDDAGAAQNRRKATLNVLMRVPILRLVDIVALRLQVQVLLGTELDVSAETG